MEDHGLGKSAENPHLSAQAALMTWARKRDVDEGELQKSWEHQVTELGLSGEIYNARVKRAERKRPAPDLFTDRGTDAREAATWSGGTPLGAPTGVRPRGPLDASAGAETGKVTVASSERGCLRT